MKIKYADKNRIKIKIKIKLSIKIKINKINNKIKINNKRETIITKQTFKHEQNLSTNKI